MLPSSIMKILKYIFAIQLYSTELAIHIHPITQSTPCHVQCGAIAYVIKIYLLVFVKGFPQFIFIQIC